MEECRGSAGHALGGMMSCACRQRHVTVHPLPRHFHTSTPPHFLQGMALGYGGNPYGPAGTGKTESVKALGQAFARQVCVSGGGGGLHSAEGPGSALCMPGGGGEEPSSGLTHCSTTAEGRCKGRQTHLRTGCGPPSPAPSSHPLPMPTVASPPLPPFLPTGPGVQL